MASLLGYSRRITLCCRAQTQVDHKGRPPCITKGVNHRHSITPERGMAGTDERGTLSQEWRGTNDRKGIRQRWRGLNDNAKHGKTKCGARIQNTPPLQALAGIRVLASLLGHSCLEALCSPAITQVGQKGLGMGYVGRCHGQEQPRLVRGTHHVSGKI